MYVRMDIVKKAFGIQMVYVPAQKGVRDDSGEASVSQVELGRLSVKPHHT